MSNDWEKEFEKLFEGWILTNKKSITSVPDIKEFIAHQIEAAREGMNDCTCKEKWTFGVVHRKNEPCYLPERPESIRHQAIQDCIEKLRGMKRLPNPMVPGGYDYVWNQALESAIKELELLK